MIRKREVEAEKENSERWLLTYADLITLLMIFFVVLYSMSKVDADKFKAVAESLNRALGGATPAQIELATSPQGPSLLASGYNKDQKTEEEKQQLDQGNNEQDNITIEGIKQKLDKFAQDNGLHTQLVSSIEERGLVISIQETLLFESGSAELTPRALKILDKINTVLNTAPNYIKVEGHTDNLPIKTAKFPSNWELSVIRSTNVLQRMVNAGGISPDRLSASGFGEYRPLVSNSTEEGRARNRRVDLVILRSKYDMVEPGKYQ